MKLIPVMDLKAGQVVHAVAGDRQHYRPIQSDLCDTAEPRDVLQSLRDTVDADLVYIADLDAIEGTGNQAALIRSLCDGDVHLLLDGGFSDTRAISSVIDIRGIIPVISTESFRGFSSLVRHCNPAEVVCSIDLRQGCLRAADPELVGCSPLEVINTVVQTGIQSVIVLDVATVGTGAGLQRVLPLCREIQERHSDLRVISGGGVRSVDCVRTAAAAGIDGLLIASAFHFCGQFRSDVKSWNSGELAW